MTTLPINQTDNTHENPHVRAALVLNHSDFGSVTNTILKVNESSRPPKSWYLALAISFSMMSMLGALIG